VEEQEMNDDKQKLVSFKYEIRRKDGLARKAETILPISETRYAELAKGLSPESKAWQEVQIAIEDLAFLQGGTLGAWSIELEIQTEE
jgi:hypothetical protein